MKAEVWKSIEGFEESHEISNYGRVRSLDRYVLHSTARTPFLRKGRVLKLTKTPNGYPLVCIRLKELKRYFTVHRLVAKAFVENPQKKRFVNHKNGIKSDNMVDNLEWVTPSENNIHAIKIGLCPHFNKND